MEKRSIEFTRRAVREYKKLPEGYKALIDLALGKLENGGLLDLKPVIGEKDTFRIRIGKYRILFILRDKIAIVVKIGSRGDVYK